MRRILGDRMLVEIIKHTGIADARRAIEFTTGGRFTAKATLSSVYGWNHSITRTQMFSVMMYRIPTFVSVHFSRHKVGVEHFVQSNRPDRGGDALADRVSPVNHLMFCNAEAIINMSHRRLCYQASTETRFVMEQIKSEMLIADPELVSFLVPMCQYRGGICSEPKPCGEYKVKRIGG